MGQIIRNGVVYGEENPVIVNTLSEMKAETGTSKAAGAKAVGEIATNLTASDGTMFKFGVNENGEYGFYKPNGEFVSFKHRHINPVTGMPDESLTDDYISSKSGGCFTKIVYHKHISSCYTPHVHNPNYTWDGGCYANQPYESSYICNGSQYAKEDGTCMNCPHAYHGFDPVTIQVSGTQKVPVCGYSEGQPQLICNKTEDVTIDGYSLSCGKTAKK